MTLEPLRAVELLGDDHVVESFECGVAELDRWLQRSARVAASTGTAATYVLCRGRQVVGYYALAMSSVAHDGAPSRLRRGMPDPGIPEATPDEVGHGMPDSGNRRATPAGGQARNARSGHSGGNPG